MLRSKLASWPLDSTVQTTPLLSTSMPRGAKPEPDAFGLLNGTSKYSVSAVAGGFAPGDEAPEAAGHALNRSPDRAVRSGRDAVERHVQPLVLGRIGRLIRLGVGVALAVAVRSRARTRVQPCAFCSSWVLSQIFVSNQPSTPRPERRPQHVVLVEVRVAPRDSTCRSASSVFVFGSYISSCRPLCVIGNAFADG